MKRISTTVGVSYLIAATIAIAGLSLAPIKTFGSNDARATREQIIETIRDTRVAPPPRIYGLGVCKYEDGNPDGSPCIFSDADSGWRYVDSSEYRN